MRYVDKLGTSALVRRAQEILDTVPDYNDSDEVKNIIRVLYAGCCAFCGSSPESSSFFQIEHFYPKGNPAYAKYRKDIFNLHYSCQRCNGLKRTQVHLNIFSPNYYLDGAAWKHSKPGKIDRELRYIGHLAYPLNNRPGSEERALQTINLFDLNDKNGGGRSGRAYLVEERLRTYNAVFQNIEAIYHLLKDEAMSPNIDHAIKLLFKAAVRYFAPTSAYSNMVAQNFSEDVFKLLQVYTQKRKDLPPKAPGTRPGSAAV